MTLRRITIDSDHIKIIILGDTHGYIDDRITELSAACDVAVHTGDIMDLQVLQLLQPRSGQIYAVKGNNDANGNNGNNRSGNLPERCLLSLPGGSLCIEHGHRIWDTKNYHYRLRRKYQHMEVRAIVFGHTHKMVCDQEMQPWVLNPGAAGRVRTYGGPSCLVLTAKKRRWQVESFRFKPDR